MLRAGAALFARQARNAASASARRGFSDVAPATTVSIDPMAINPGQIYGRELPDQDAFMALDLPAMSKYFGDLKFEEIGKTIRTDEGKKEFAALNKQYMDMMDTVKPSKGPDAINWAHYEKTLDPALVKAFKDAHDVVTKMAPYPDTAKETAEVSAAFGALSKGQDASRAAMEKRMAELKAEYAAVSGLADKLNTMTIEDMYKEFPDLGAQVEEEVHAGKWYDASRA